MGRGQSGWRGGPRFTDDACAQRVRADASSGNRIATTGRTRELLKVLSKEGVRRVAAPVEGDLSSV